MPYKSFRRRRRSNSFQSLSALIFQSDAIEHYTMVYTQNILTAFPEVILSDSAVAEKLIRLLLTNKNSTLTKKIKEFVAMYVYRIEEEESSKEENQSASTFDTLRDLFDDYGDKTLYKDALHLFTLFFDEKIERTQKATKDIDQQIADLTKVFRLDSDEAAIIRGLYIFETSDLIDDMHRLINDAVDIRSRRGSNDSLILTIPTMLNFTRHKVRSMVSDSGRLRKMGLLDSDNDIASEVKEFVDGFSTTPLVNRYYRISKFKDVLPLSYFSRLQKDTKIISALIKNREEGKPLNIMLYGVPGTGKTAYVNALTKKLRRRLFEVRINGENGRNNEDNRLFRKRCIVAATNSSDDKDILLIDEADSLLNSAKFSFFGTSVDDTVKEQVNEILDRVPRVVFWITNRQNGMDESTCRRMDYSIKFEPLTTEERAVIWRNAVKALTITEKISKAQYLSWAQKYETTAGGITVSLRNAKLLAQEGETSFIDAVDIIMKPHLAVTHQKLNTASTTSKHYSLEAITVKNDSLSEIIESVESFATRLKSGEELLIPNYNILLYGVPGTGKTAFANHLAETLKVPLVKRKASDIMGMYVGQNEKNIAQAFAEAEKKQGILFIDEADTFLGERSGAHQSWEVSMVNEFLTQMEQFKGILICATNFRDIVDSAATRRFVRKVEFDYLTPKGITALCKSYFNLTPRSKTTQAIAQLTTLTPGDFWTVFRHWYFLPQHQREQFDFVAAFEHESLEKGAKVRSIGFAA